MADRGHRRVLIRRLAVAVGLILCFLASEGGFALYSRHLEGNFEALRDRHLERSLAEVGRLFDLRRIEAERLAKRVAEVISTDGLLAPDGSFDAIGIFRLLEGVALPQDISGLSVKDARGRTAAWKGKTFDSDDAVGLAAAAGIFRSRIYRVLFSQAPIGPESGPYGAVLVFSPFDINYPLRGRRLGGADFEETVLEEFRLRDIDISGGDGALRRAGEEDSRLATTIDGPDGTPLANLNVQAFPLEADLARLVHTRDRFRAVFVALLLLFLTWISLRTALSAGASLLWLPVLAATALAARVGMYLAQFPKNLVAGPAFDPTRYSHLTEILGLDLGLLQSPGDAVLTGVFVVGVLAAALRVLTRRLTPLLPERPRPAAGAAVTVAAVLLTGLLITMWLSLLHTFIFDSTVDFFSEQTVFPDSAPALLIAGMFLSTVALLLVAATSIRTGLRILGGPGMRGAAFVALPVALVFGLLAVGTALSVLVSAWCAAIVGGAILLVFAWHRTGYGIRLATLTILATLFAFPPFIDLIWTETRADVAEEAEELFRHTEERTFEDRLQADVAEIAQDEWLVSRIRRAVESPSPELAFRLWARSPLSRRSTGCDIVIRDRTGQRELSHFEIDMPPRDWLPAPLTGSSPEAVASWWDWVTIGDRKLRFIVCQAPIRSPDGEFIAQLIVRMPRDPLSTESARRPDILRPYDLGGSAPEDRDLFYSEYDGTNLTFTTNPDFPRVLSADPEVFREVLEGKTPALWRREKISDGYWINLYRPRFEDDRVVGMMCVSFRSKETRSILFSVFQLLLVNSVVALAVILGPLLIPLRRFSLRFQHKLLLSYLVISAVPVVLLAEVNRTIARETVEEGMRKTLRSGMRLVTGELRTRGPLDGVVPEITDEQLKEIAYRMGMEVNLFMVDAWGRGGAPLVASSEPGIFATELFADRLDGKAWLETVLLGREFLVARETAGGYSYLVGYSPVVDQAGEAVAVIGLPLIYEQDAVDRELARRNTLVLALYLMILLAVFFTGMLLAKRISSPIERLAEGTRRLSAGDLDYRIPGKSTDEFGDLVASFNQMTEDIREGRERIVKAEKDAAWREMAKQVAHEVKNPLTPMRLSAQHILRAWKDRHEEFDEILSRGIETIIRQTESLTRIAGEFSAFARLPTIRLEPTCPSVLVHEVAGLYRGSQDIEVVEKLGETAPVLADREELRRVLVNLMTNAVQAMEDGGGTLEIRTGTVRARSGGADREVVEIAVTDTGTGIDPRDIPRLFQPNFSTKTGGTGLGLALVKAVVERIGGTIRVDSTPGKGTTMTVRLPAVES